MNPEEFFKRSLDKFASVKGIDDASKRNLVDHYQGRYLRGQFSGKPSTLFSETAIEAKKVAKVTKSR
jgi:hypothetical protein